MDTALWFVFDVILMLTGTFVVSLVTLGHWRGERLMSNEARIYGAAGAFSFVRDGQRVVTGLGLSIVGTLFYFILVVVCVAVR